MRATACCCRPLRPYYNLPSKSEHGRKMTGFLTPYRHFMWKQNELWRNVHEAQFEHLRKVYKRQWLEAFRVNSDEYLYKYNITKAAQMAQWELEMHAQEKKRVENAQLAQGRQSLKRKHMDLLREFHERQFFYWFERASERLQYMTLIRYVPQSQIQDHIEAELDKYVVGSKSPYPLNFAGQMPLLEDAEGNIAEVPQTLMVNHTTENLDASAKAYSAPESVTLAEEQLLHLLASAHEESLAVPGVVNGADAAAFTEAVNDVLRHEEAQDADVKVAKSVEDTEEDREISRRTYIDRGKTGVKTISRPRTDATGETILPSSTSSAPAVRRHKKSDRLHAAQQKFDKMAQEMQQNLLKQSGATAAEVPNVGDVGAAVGKLREKIRMPSVEDIQSSTATDNVRMQTILNKKYQRGKFKPGGSSTESEDL